VITYDSFRRSPTAASILAWLNSRAFTIPQLARGWGCATGHSRAGLWMTTSLPGSSEGPLCPIGGWCRDLLSLGSTLSAILEPGAALIVLGAG
jgi:hypothetical protein